MVLLGLVLAAGMVIAGVWQFQVYQRQGAEAAAARAAEPPVPLSSVARAGAPVGDGYGRTVTFRGSYEAEHQVLVPLPDRTDTFRVVTLLRLENGDAVAVVRGVVTGRPPPPPPAGPLDQAGILLPSEEAVEPAGGRRARLGPDRPAGPALAGAAGRRVRRADRRRRPAQRLTPAEVALPDARGRLRNAAYALQWWLLRRVHRGDGGADRP